LRYVCQICGFIYDDAKEKVPFSSLPDDWVCPLCNAPKSEFKPENKPAQSEANENKSKTESTAKTDSKQVNNIDLKKLTPGQLSAVFSNLARGSEKQYKPEEAKLFTELAEYFRSITSAPEDATIEALSESLKKDIDDYPTVRAAADKDKDRGAARVCVWGEKVTRMLSSILDRYLKEGNSMFEGKDIWICTVCGFIYIGETPPDLCPVCKVESWKFNKSEGRI
jgi:rubrerythrin